MNVGSIDPDKPIVRSQHILTAQGHAFIEFGIELSKMMQLTNEETIDFYRGKKNHYMEYSLKSL
ncbi:hypothetical protein [Cytobacillus purgationiresistens]|uniref:Uncharacterized protein n=1 Tax=Cytobacillus purgationiresistens TaxID=863449 RepID=A0ABU0ADM9_9BACI|nr:hypothetical protein [Cytobacillus purgationiresistens]MDQ0268205.1 hypothetical protein [Cytobacillus purgationiresistens]